MTRDAAQVISRLAVLNLLVKNQEKKYLSRELNNEFIIRVMSTGTKSVKLSR